ncbi:hypothetical protein ABK040_015881 [Willaertia magna]
MNYNTNETIDPKVYHSIEKCLNDGKDVLYHSPLVNHLIHHINEQNKKGCHVLTKGIQFKMCDLKTDQNELNNFQRMSIGGEMNVPNEKILICCNRTHGRYGMEQVLIHELVHAYDHCRFKYLRQFGCKFRACTEIRSYNLSFQCFTNNELEDFNGNREECIKHWATMSTIPFCNNAQEKVEKMFEKCFHDYTPFPPSKLAPLLTKTYPNK